MTVELETLADRETGQTRRWRWGVVLRRRGLAEAEDSVV
jgi:hypothetical protein